MDRQDIKQVVLPTGITCTKKKGMIKVFNPSISKYIACTKPIVS